MTAPAAIVLVTTSYPIEGDGREAAGAFVRDLAEEIANQVPVRVVAPGPDDRIEAPRAGVTVHRYAAPDRPLSTLRPWLPADAAAIARVMRSGLAATRAAAASGPTARLVALWALPSGHWARRVARERGLPYDVWTLGSDIWSLGRIPIVRRWLRTVLRDAARCFSDGIRLAEDTRAIAGRPVEFLPSTRRITRVRETPARTEPPFRLLFLGRWHPNKGIDLLLDALALLGDDDWQRIESVTIAGGGPLEALVRERVAALQAADRPVILRGYLAQAEAEDAICQADWLLIPSRIESIPVVFSDAVKLGCPVIATPVGDLPPILNPAAGIAAQAAEAGSLSLAIKQALNNLRPDAQKTLLGLAQRFNLQATAEQLIANFNPSRQ